MLRTRQISKWKYTSSRIYGSKGCMKVTKNKKVKSRLSKS